MQGRATILLAAALASQGAGAASPAEYLDTTFGDGGIVTFAGLRSARPALQLADGSLIVVNEATDVLETVSITKLDRSGAFDRSFGQQGTVRADPTSPYTSVNAVFDGGNGRVVLTGWLYPLSRPYLKRLNRDGTPDASFGNADVLLYRDGRAQPSLGNPGVLDFGYTAPKIGPPTPSCYSDSVIAYHPTADGGALAVVHRGLQDCFGFAVSFETYLVRIQPSGALDESYGRTSLGWGLGSYGSRLLPDGRLELWTGAGKGLVAADGRSVAFASGAPANAPTTLFPRDTYVQPDGSWIVLPQGSPPPSFEVHRPDGQPEALFGNAGRPIESGSPGSYLVQAFRTPDGGVAGILAENTLEHRRLCVWRANGRIESCSSLPDWRDSVLERGMMAPDGSLYLSGNGPGGLPSLARFSVTAPNVEYFNSQLRHYFVTYDGTEARFIDEGGAGPAWSRTGQGFKTGGTTPVCRFYGTPGIGSNSHFFTISAQECELVKKDPGWTFEGYGFYATPAVNGQCEAPLVPVHRLYNNRAAQRDSNHRHVSDVSLISPMVLAGWAYEGVAFCVRP